jgi:spore maturation protein CgeB
MSEVGNELFIMPYHGHSMDSLWWKSIPNPNYIEGEILQRVMKVFGSSKKNKSKLVPSIARSLTTPKIEKYLSRCIEKQKDIDAIILVNIPLNQIKGLAKKMKSRYNIPVILYDIDVPTSLPSSGGFTFNHYLGADLHEFDSIVIPSEGSKESLKDLGANNVDILHFGVDPEVYELRNPLSKEIDLFFYGMGGKAREKNVKLMLADPSKRMSSNFLISGSDFNFDIGNSKLIPLLSFNQWKNYCGKSKINLNIVRDLHARVYATSTSRPFELAAMKCCIVSSPYWGLDKWFSLGQDMVVANSAEEAIEIYEELLLDEEKRERMGLSAYERVMKEHTARNRAMQMMQIIERYQ